MDENPFELYDLDPRDGIAAITARLRELAEEAEEPAERERIRAAWEELTLHPGRRVRAALFAHPDTRPPLGAPPPRPRVRATPAAPPSLDELAARPSARAALEQSLRARIVVDDGPPPLDDDPHLGL